MNNSRFPRWQRLIYPDWLVSPLREHLARPKGTFVTDTFQTCLLVYRLTLLSPVFWVGVVLWFLLEPVLNWPADQLFRVVYGPIGPFLIRLSYAMTSADFLVILIKESIRTAFQLLPGFVAVGITVFYLLRHPLLVSATGRPRSSLLQRTPVFAASVIALPFIVVFALQPVVYGIGFLIYGVEDLIPIRPYSDNTHIVAGLVYLNLAGLLSICLLPWIARCIFDHSIGISSAFQGTEIALAVAILVSYPLLFMVAEIFVVAEVFVEVNATFQIFVLLQLFLTVGFIHSLDRAQTRSKSLPAAQVFD